MSHPSKLRLLTEIHVRFYNHKASRELLRELKTFRTIVDHLAFNVARRNLLFYEVVRVRRGQKRAAR